MSDYPAFFRQNFNNQKVNPITRVNKKQISDADLILNQLHLEIKQALHQTETKNEDGMEMSLVVVEPEKKAHAICWSQKSTLVHSRR